MQRFREGGIFSLVALYALVLEIFFGAMHAAALAATAAGRMNNPDSFIFMICSPQGLRASTAAELQSVGNEQGSRQPARNSASDFCPVCGSTAVSPFSMAQSPCLAVALHHVHFRFIPPAVEASACAGPDLLRIRAPPLS